MVRVASIVLSFIAAIAHLYIALHIKIKYTWVQAASTILVYICIAVAKPLTVAQFSNDH